LTNRQDSLLSPPSYSQDGVGIAVSAQAKVPEGIVAQTNPLAMTWARRATVIGALVLLLALLLIWLPTTSSAPEVCGHSVNVLAFELARTPSDLAIIFGPPGSACAKAMGEAMDWVNRIDLPFFIGGYFLFLCSSVLFESSRQRQRRWLWGLLFAGVALAGDLLETTLLLQITRQLDDPAMLLAPLAIATWIKWIGLAAFGGLAAYCGWQAAPRGWPLALAGGFTVALTLAAMSDPMRFALLMVAASGALWLILWMRAVLASGWFGVKG
jgi:hypothetical protein